jgi:hypothetical protein
MQNLYAEPAHAWLAPSDLYLETQGEQKAGGDTATLRALRGRKNRVQLGVPQTTDVLAAWPANERLEAEIAAAKNHFDFYCVHIACSFIPDRGCHFVHVQLDVTLTDGDAAIAVDLFPREVSVKRAFSRKFGLKGGLKLSFIELSADAERKAEAVRYEPTLTCAGLLTSAPSWTFNAAGADKLTGVSELFLLVKKPKNRPLAAQFTLGAEVETAWGLLRYSNDRLLEAAYQLTP